MDKIIQYLNNSNKPIYVTGKSGSGKTTMLKQLPFSVKFISIQDINSYNDLELLVQPSIIQKMMNKNLNNHVCVIDDIDYLQNNDKKILTLLLKQFKLENKKKCVRNFKIILCGTNNYDKNY